METEEQEVNAVETTEEEQVSQATAPVVEHLKPASAPELGAEAQLAADALEAVEEAEDVTVPVGVVAGLRAKGREKDQVIQAKDQLIEHLKSEIEQRNAPIPELSPAEKYIAEHDEFDPDMDALPAAVLIANDKWKDGRAEAKAKADVQTKRQQLGQQSYTKAKAAFTDYDDIVTMGTEYLTPGDKVDIAMSDDPATALYKKSISRVLESGTEDAAVLRNHLKSKLTKSQSSPKPKQTQAKETQPEQQPEEPEEIMNPRLAHIYNVLDL